MHHFVKSYKYENASDKILFQLRRLSVNMIGDCTFLYISNSIIWEKPRHWFGTRSERRALVRYIKEHTASLPITVRVTRIRKSRNYCFKPVLVNGSNRKVMFAHKQFRIAFELEDVIPWIKTYIETNGLFEQEQHHYIYYNI